MIVALEVRRCSYCRVERPASDFNKCKSKNSGRQSYCKACKAEYARQWRKRHPKRAKESKRRYLRRHPERPRMYMQKHYRDSPEMAQAKAVVGYALAVGKIIKPPRCTVCGKGGRVEGHHISYQRHHRLAVFWLCSMCHAIAHRLGGFI